MKAFSKSFIVLLMAATFFLACYLLRDSLSIIVIYVGSMCTCLGLIFFFMFHKFRTKGKRQYTADENTKLAPPVKPENK